MHHASLSKRSRSQPSFGQPSYSQPSCRVLCPRPWRVATPLD